jgi:hypothetical protein
MADIVASVPELHIRTFSTEGTHSQIFFAISTSNKFGMPNEIPLFATSWMVLVIATGAWPRMFGPHDPM